MKLHRNLVIFVRSHTKHMANDLIGKLLLHSHLEFAMIGVIKFIAYASSFAKSTAHIRAPTHKTIKYKCIVVYVVHIVRISQMEFFLSKIDNVT